ncbi:MULTISPECIES: GDYXXLXY domain-containing protein [Flavobacterium]|uniref:GDYXXLXY domain-containing protein n=1 Tax=Flavobacterium TaxID=237 RepID=UPI00086C7291|nr:MULTISPECIES: GDYXXLXY domain-containing protein [Flavobacterium]MBN9283384.1 GDYXXLXY domain-containing protein [Flavobacterium sp.]ODS87084.1 MAG: hypothetical protein ABS44_12115 [Chryseobacterium sp. SCN 40-13]OJV69492.1 MAG: hypothetical protein BGO42_14090 [Flavobacterium sp. 40-81]
MKTKHLLLLFGLVALVQIIVPASMIFKNQEILKNGTVYKFKTAPVDPNNPFVGKYISLNYNLNSFPSTDSIWEGSDKIYLYLTRDQKGFAAIKSVSKVKRNDTKDDFVVAKVNYAFGGKVYFNLPFNTYYMEEGKAYDAEVAYREQQNDTITYPTYALVHIKDGQAVLSDVIIKDIPIKDYVSKK